jgi:hypothetical protein
MSKEVQSGGNWWQEYRGDKAIKVILFIISPFFSFLYSLRRMNTRSSYIVFFLFAAFFGMAFTVDNYWAEGVMDGVSYRMGFEYDHEYMSFSDYIDGLEVFFTFDVGKKDYYYDTVSFFISRVTGNYHVMFMVLAMIFACFMLKSLRFLTSEEKFNYSIASLILAYLFTTNQIFNINGVRMWTAAWVGVYALFQIFRNNNKRYFLLLLITPLFHGSFWILIAVTFLAYFFMRFNKVWTVLFVISFFVGSIAVELLQNLSDHLPAFLQRLVDSYTDSEYIDKVADQGITFLGVKQPTVKFPRFYVNAMIFLFIKESSIIKENLKTKHLYMFLLVFMTFVNFTLAVPSLGSRYFNLAYPLVAYIWLVNFKDIKYQKFLYSMVIVFAYIIYLQINQYLRVLDFSFFFMNPIVLIYKHLIMLQ